MAAGGGHGPSANSFESNSFSFYYACMELEANLARTGIFVCDKMSEDLAKDIGVKLKAAYPDFECVYTLRGYGGGFKPQVLVEMKSGLALQSFGKSIILNDESYVFVSNPVLESKTASMPIKSDLLLRKIPKFTGSVSSGTSVADWLVSVDELLDDKRWGGADLYSLIRNSLNGPALMVAQNFTSFNPRELRNYIHQ